MKPLAKVSSEVEESQKKLYFVNICISAQQKLIHKLQNEAQQRKETCQYIRKNNMQMQNEILNAEHDIKSMLTACETIKSANSKLKTELLLTRRRNSETVERMKTAEKKYNELWLQSRKRYESIPFVQEWLQTAKKVETLKENVNVLDIEAKTLRKDIEVKKNTLKESDRKQIVRMAEFIVRERPQSLILIQEKSGEISELTKDIERIVMAQKLKSDKLISYVSASLTKSEPPPSEEMYITNAGVGKYPNNSQESNDMVMMPKLQLANMEFGYLSVKLELNKVVKMKATPIKRPDYATEFEKTASKRFRNETNINDDYISSLLTKRFAVTNVDERKENDDNYYSKMKLINILEDVRLDDKETYNIVSNVNPVQLRNVNMIGADVAKTVDTPETTKSKAPLPAMESEEIEEIDLSAMNTQSIILPPTQFTDRAQKHILRSKHEEVEIIVDLSVQPTTASRQYNLPQIKSSQEIVAKKVSFDLPLSVQEIVDDEMGKDSEQSVADETTDTINSHAEDLPATAENYLSIKDMILKKHHLSSSPEFVYAKHTGLLQKDKVVTSKFFDHATQSTETVGEQENANENRDDQQPIDQDMAADAETDEAVTILKRDTNLVKGLLFTHGPNGIPESLDISMSTTGYEEGDGYYPHCLDSSLLLSPKADWQPIAGNGNPGEVGTEEIPNFLSGFRKTGLFFFGQSAPAEANPGSSASAPNQENNFNFNFGEKRNKGGLSSFFR